MKHTLRLFSIHQTATSLQRTDKPNPRTIWYPALDESNRIKRAYFTIHPGKNPPPQNGCWLKSICFLFKSTGFTSSTFRIQPEFSQNQPAAITLKNWFSSDIASSTLTSINGTRGVWMLRSSFVFAASLNPREQASCELWVDRTWHFEIRCQFPQRRIISTLVASHLYFESCNCSCRKLLERSNCKAHRSGNYHHRRFRIFFFCVEI